MPKISVIMPVYNAQQYLNQSIRSVMNQSFTDFELILINDGSTDYSLAYCQSLARKDSRLRVLDLPHHGVAAARAEGIRAAKGSYISFVDADDWVEKDYLQHLYTTITENHADISMCYTVLDASNISECADVPFESGVYSGDALELLKNKSILCESDKTRFLAFSCLWDLLFRAELIRANVRYMDNDAVVATDTLLSTACCLDSRCIAVIDAVDYHYCQRADSIVHSQQKRCPQEKLRELEVFRKVLLAIVKEKGYAGLCEKADTVCAYRLYNIFFGHTEEELGPIPETLKELIQSLSEQGGCARWAETVKALKSYIE